MEKWPFLVNTDGLGISLSFYFKRIKSEPDLQSEACGKFPALRDPAAPRVERPPTQAGGPVPTCLMPSPAPGSRHLTPPLKASYLLPALSEAWAPSVSPLLPSRLCLRHPGTKQTSTNHGCFLGKAVWCLHSCREVWGCSQVLRRRYLWAWPGRHSVTAVREASALHP